jgi:hypothetical protein
MLYREKHREKSKRRVTKWDREWDEWKMERVKARGEGESERRGRERDEKGIKIWSERSGREQKRENALKKKNEGYELV